MKKCLFPLVAALSILVGCNGNCVSYKGFSFEYPEEYSLQKNVTKDGMRCLLTPEGGDDLYMVEVIPDFKEEWGLENAGNKEVGDYLANAVYDMYNKFFHSDKKDVKLDNEFVIDCSKDSDYSPYAYAEVSGRIGDAPFRAVINSDLWGDNQVTTTIIAYSDERYDEMFNQIFGTYTWIEK